MKDFRADLHIHTLLSPCGDLGMSPENIVSEAVKKGLDIIGITDHNSTFHCRLLKKTAASAGIFVMTGAEVTTKEEVHCLVFFENTDTLDIFQELVDRALPDIMNDPDIFGDQVVLDENENIIFSEPRLLTNALSLSIDEIEKFVHEKGGLFIPAHIDRMKNSIYSQLGFLPANLNADALEISRRTTYSEVLSAHSEISGFPVISNSDAHNLSQIGMATTIFTMEKAGFNEIKLALQKSGKRNFRIG